MSRLFVPGMVAVVLWGVPVTGVFAQRSVATDNQTNRDVVNSAVATEAFARPVTVRLEQMSLKQAVNAIAANAGVRLQYRETMLDAVRQPVTLQVVGRPLGEVLERVLARAGLQAVSSVRNVVTIRSAEEGVRVAQGAITGRVTDVKTKRPIVGATVTLDEAGRGVVTGEDGMFRVANVVAGSHTVRVKLLGYGRAVRTVMVIDDAVATVNVELQSSANTLEQIVVTGTVIPTELKAVPNAITVITAKQLEDRGITHIEQLFRGDVPGLFASNQVTASNSLGRFGQVLMFSRGATALDIKSVGGPGANPANALTNPIKTYVDGVELADPRYLSQIDPQSIERIEIVTGPQASTIYGSNAMNGVMQIFTKRGTSNTPQLTLNLRSGWVENDFSPARTPRHDYSAQLNGIERRLSYNAGGSWNYMGRWSPSSQAARLAGFGGARLELPTRLGRVSGDVSLQHTLWRNVQQGNSAQTLAAYRASGWIAPAASPLDYGVAAPSTATVAGQTLGLSLSYAPTTWWSQEIGIGTDVSDAEYRTTAPGYTSLSDTSLSISQSRTNKRSLRYVTTARVPMSRLAQLTLTVGGDQWQSVGFDAGAKAQTLNGVYNSGSLRVRPSHSGGGFLQTQFGVKDALFLTYGLRVEWNPDYGADANPNLAPRVGAALTHDLGPVTAKLRASYGRSTRPPAKGAKAGQTIAESYGTDWPYYKDIVSLYYANLQDFQFANPDLGPEVQAGGEGGMELYLGTRASVVVTRYNQTVDDLLAYPAVDSLRTLIPCSTDPQCIASVFAADGYGYWYQYQWVNLGSIRNQGWELQGTGVLGPFTTRATYSWMKSRVLGVKPRYRGYFASNPQYQPGASFTFFPEHTWALGTTYARGGSTIGINLMGTGQATNQLSALGLKYSSPRLLQDNPRRQFNPQFNGWARAANAPYVLADLNASHRFSRLIDGVLDVHNLEDRYVNDVDARYATKGRQVNAGLRIRTP
jgi:outer membrane receptor protein involved in Fe transport